MRQELGTTGHGREAAASHGTFVSAYAIVEDRRGKRIVGTSPDGRLDFMCMRCSKALKSVYVFANADRSSYMHVGADCAEKMGVPLSEIRKATDYFDALERAKRDQANASKRAAEAAARAEEIRVNRAASATLVAEIEHMLKNPNVTRFERDVLRDALAACEASSSWYQREWLVDLMREWSMGERARDVDFRYANLSAQLDSVRDRLALAATSRPVVGKQITGAFRAYRAHISFDTQYGTMYVSFVTDDAGNAYVIKSAEFIVRQGCTVIATFSLGESDERDGLTSTRLLRPRKINLNCYQDPITAWSFVSVDDAWRYRSE